MARPASRKTNPIRSVAFVSLGCPKNLVDSERMLGLLAEDGLAITSDPSDADAIVVNTCGFLEASRTESLEAIREAIRMKTQGRCKRVVVAGCLVQRHKTRLLADVPEVDRLVGVFDREHIVEAVHGKENPRQEHGHFLGKYHDLSRELAAGARTEEGMEEGTKGRRDVGTKGEESTSAPSSLRPFVPSSLSPSPLRQTKTNRLPVFEDDRARLRLTP